MKIFNIAILIFFFLPLNLTCVKAENNIHKKAYKEAQAGGAIILDVREQEELEASGKAKGAKWIPMSKIRKNHYDWQNFLKAQAKDKALYIYCASGGRAGVVVRSLTEKGFKATNLGGLRDLKSAGLIVVPFKK